MADILPKCKTLSLKQIKDDFSEEDQVTLDEYFSFIVDEGFGFLSEKNESDLLPELDLTYLHPSIISNAIVDLDEHSEHDFANIFLQLEELGCKDIQVRYFSSCTILELSEMLGYLLNSRIRSVELLLQYSDEMNAEALRNLCAKNLKIMHITVVNAEDEHVLKSVVDLHTHVVFTKEKIDNSSCCGIIHADYFTINIPTFTEAKSYNSCLNRKISVDKIGNIKNCPSMTKSYGNIKNTRIKEVVKQPEFKKIWNLNKDQIDTCMDCEFRYMCTDCRAFLDEGDNELSKPLKCTYDPYSATWGEDSPKLVSSR